MDYRTILAAVLGIGLSVVLIAVPEVVVRAHTTGRVPGERDSEYGADSVPEERTRRLVQVLVIVAVIAGLYFGATLLWAV